MAAARMHLIAHGRVQGVGYRYFARRAAQGLKLTGWVRNCDDGSVEAEVQGPADRLAFLADLLREGPPGGHVTSLESHGIPVREGEEGFEVRF